MTDITVHYATTSFQGIPAMALEFDMLGLTANLATPIDLPDGLSIPTWDLLWRMIEVGIRMVEERLARELAAAGCRVRH